MATVLVTGGCGFIGSAARCPSAPERAFGIVLQLLLTALAMRLIWKAASGAGLI